MSLTSRLDGFEGRFLRLWVAASIAMLLINCALLELFSWQGAIDQTDPELADVGFDFAALEGLIYSIAFVLVPIVAWMALGRTYPRPSLAVWISWMAFSLVVFTMLFVAALAAFAPEEGSAPEIGIGTYIVAYVIDVSSKLGLILAFLTVSWRVASSVGVTSLFVAFVLAVLGISSGFNEVIRTLETFHDESDWRGIEWDEFLIWTIETIILGLASGLAIIYGNRWQVRDVDDRVFD